MGTEDKTLFCFCHWGRKNKVLPDGSASYVGGITDQIIVKTGIKYNGFVNAVFNRLGMDPSDKILHFTVKFDRSELIRLRDQESVDALLQFNDGSAHIYASDLEEPYSRQPSGGAEKVECIVVSDSEQDTIPADDDENDLESPLKKAQFQSTEDREPQRKGAVGGDDQKLAGVTRSCNNSLEILNQTGAWLPKGHAQNNSSKVGTVNEHASDSVVLVIDSDSELDTIPDAEPDTVPDNNPPELYDLPDPELSDFDKHKAENCFAADQIRAIYDELDAMPRYYAHVKKVFGPEFKMKLRWLMPHPEEDQRECAWVKAGLPVGCGKFIRGNIEYTTARLMFSHQVQCEKEKSGMYILYPRKGETWALFKDWDIRWSLDSKNHREYKYEVVAILSDYVKNVGVKVGYLDKVTGFVSLFQRTKLTVVCTFFIKPKELYKFSHQIPSFKMTGTEGEDVPAGSFELDPASLPLDPDNIWYPVKVQEEIRTAKSEPVENITVVPLGTRNKFRTAEHIAMTSLKCGNLKGIH